MTAVVSCLAVSLPEDPPAHGDTRLDAETLETILERVRSRLLGLLAHYRIPPEDGEDILQHVLLTLVYKQDSIRCPERWLVGALRNTCLRYWRRRRRERTESTTDEQLEWLSGASPPVQELGDLRRDLETVLGRLPPRCRDVLKLRYALGFRSNEVAEATGYRPSNVRKITSRCLRELGRELGAERAAGSPRDPVQVPDGAG